MGPFKVTRIMPPSNAVIQRSKRTQPFVVHVEKLKRCYKVPPTSAKQAPFGVGSDNRDGPVEHPAAMGQNLSSTQDVQGERTGSGSSRRPPPVRRKTGTPTRLCLALHVGPSDTYSSSNTYPCVFFVCFLLFVDCRRSTHTQRDFKWPNVSSSRQRPSSHVPIAMGLLRIGATAVATSFERTLEQRRGTSLFPHPVQAAAPP